MPSGSTKAYGGSVCERTTNRGWEERSYWRFVFCARNSLKSTRLPLAGLTVQQVFGEQLLKSGILIRKNLSGPPHCKQMSNNSERSQCQLGRIDQLIYRHAESLAKSSLKIRLNHPIPSKIL